MELTRTADDVGSMERAVDKDERHAEIGRSLALQKGEFSELIGTDSPNQANGSSPARKSSAAAAADDDDDDEATDGGGDGGGDAKNALLAAIRKKAKSKKKLRAGKGAAAEMAAGAASLDELKQWAFEFEAFRARASAELERLDTEHVGPMAASIAQLCEYFGESFGGGGEGEGEDPAQRIFETLHQVLVAFNESTAKLRRQRDAAARLARHAEHSRERRASLQVRRGGRRQSQSVGALERVVEQPLDTTNDAPRAVDDIVVDDGAEAVTTPPPGGGGGGSGGVPPKDDPRYSKYFKMLKMGLPKGAVAAKMSAEGVDPAVLDMELVAGGATAQSNGGLPPAAAPREAEPVAPVVLPARLRLLDGM